MSAIDSGLQNTSNVVLTKSPRGGISKRIVDIVLSSSMLLAFLPLMLFIVLLIKVEERGPALFGHERVGYNGRRFRCLKFRSMAVNAKELLEAYLQDNPAARREWELTQKLRDDPRITPLGRFLRKTSLDELPQLVNVLRGDMSLVGPRPIVQDEMARYNEHITDYLCVRPGITGLWQVSGRSDVDYDRRVDLDIRYVRTWSLSGDISILLRTVLVVFSRSGSY